MHWFCTCNYNMFMSNWTNKEGTRLCKHCVQKLAESKEKFILYSFDEARLTPPAPLEERK